MNMKGHPACLLLLHIHECVLAMFPFASSLSPVLHGPTWLSNHVSTRKRYFLPLFFSYRCYLRKRRQGATTISSHGFPVNVHMRFYFLPLLPPCVTEKKKEAQRTCSLQYLQFQVVLHPSTQKILKKSSQCTQTN